MSCDWHIICLDCGEANTTYGEHVHRFNDANHKDEEMWTLIRHADSIAAAADVIAEGIDIHFSLGSHNGGFGYGDIDAAWFKRHLGHQLWPINEYGALDTQCQKRVECDHGHHHSCQLEDKHDGPCSGRGWYKRAMFVRAGDIPA